MTETLSNQSKITTNMKTKKLYKTPSIKVIEIDPRDILATSPNVDLPLVTYEIEEEGNAD